MTIDVNNYVNSFYFVVKCKWRIYESKCNCTCI